MFKETQVDLLIEGLIHQGNDGPIPESLVVVEDIAEKVFFEQIHEGNQEVEAWGRRTRADVPEEIESPYASKKNLGEKARSHYLLMLLKEKNQTKKKPLKRKSSESEDEKEIGIEDYDPIFEITTQDEEWWRAPEML